MTQEIASKLGCLRAIKPEELELMLSWRNAPSVRANMYTRHEIRLAEHRAWWERIQTCADQQYFMYAYQGAALVLPLILRCQYCLQFELRKLFLRH